MKEPQELKHGNSLRFLLISISLHDAKIKSYTNRTPIISIPIHYSIYSSKNQRFCNSSGNAHIPTPNSQYMMHFPPAPLSNLFC